MGKHLYLGAGSLLPSPASSDSQVQAATCRYELLFPLFWSFIPWKSQTFVKFGGHWSTPPQSYWGVVVGAILAGVQLKYPSIFCLHPPEGDSQPSSWRKGTHCKRVSVAVDVKSHASVPQLCRRRGRGAGSAARTRPSPRAVAARTCLWRGSWKPSWQWNPRRRRTVT